MINNLLEKVDLDNIDIKVRENTEIVQVGNVRYHFNPRGKLILGAYYALTLDPSSEYGSAFSFDLPEELFASNDSTTFMNATKEAYPLKFVVDYVQFRQNCTVVYFTIRTDTRKQMYDMPEMFIDIYGVNIAGTSGKLNTPNGVYETKKIYVNPRVKSDSYIITDNFDDILAITTHEDPTPEPEHESEPETEVEVETNKAAAEKSTKHASIIEMILRNNVTEEKVDEIVDVIIDGNGTSEESATNTTTTDTTGTTSK